MCINDFPGNFPVEVDDEEAWIESHRYKHPQYEAGPHPGALWQVLELEKASYVDYVSGYMLFRGGIKSPHECIDPRDLALGRKDEATWLFFVKRKRNRCKAGSPRMISVKINPRMRGMTVNVDGMYVVADLME